MKDTEQKLRKSLDRLLVETAHLEVTPTREVFRHGIREILEDATPSTPASRILRLEGEYAGVRYGQAALPEAMTAAEIFDRLLSPSPRERADA